MIQNTTPANQPAQVNPLLRRNQADDFIRLQDLFYLCLAKWRWFILSLAVTLGIATYYILTTPNVYQRTASLMIKDDSKSQGISSDVSSMFADMGLGNAKSNVNNELIAIQSPAVLLETGKRLKLDVDYAIDGAFHKEALYGGDLPVTVDFIGFTDDQSGSFQLQLKGDGSYVISRLKGVTRDNLPVDDSDEITGRLGQIIHTPLGKIKVDKAPSYTQFVKNGDAPVLYVSRSNIYAMTDRIKGSLAASLSEEKSTVIDLTYKDVLPKRAEDVINTIISVYRKNWLEDKNQMTISTSHFITERLGGPCLINMTGTGETMLEKDIVKLCQLLLEQGHYIEFVTNLTMTKVVEQFLKLPASLQKHMEFKISFHYNELKRLHLLDNFFENVDKIQKSDFSFALELMPYDALNKEIDQIYDLCMEKAIF